MTTVRKATPADAPYIAAMERAYIDCPWTEKQVAEEIANPAVVFLAAEHCGELCGYVSGVVSLDECEMSNIAVAKDCRRRGIGRSLMDRFTAELLMRGVKSVFLLVRNGNVAAVALYEKCGFIRVGVRKNYYKDSDALIMRLNLG